MFETLLLVEVGALVAIAGVALRRYLTAAAETLTEEEADSLVAWANATRDRLRANTRRLTDAASAVSEIEKEN